MPNLTSRAQPGARGRIRAKPPGSGGPLFPRKADRKLGRVSYFFFFYATLVIATAGRPRFYMTARPMCMQSWPLHRGLIFFFFPLSSQEMTANSQRANLLETGVSAQQNPQRRATLKGLGHPHRHLPPSQSPTPISLVLPSLRSWLTN